MRFIAGRSRRAIRSTSSRASGPRSGRVGLQLPDAFATIVEGLAWIEALPFEVCSIGSIYPDEWIKLDGIGFGNMHSSHGWACAFRGKGHDRLVSRRWLDFGPWRVIRRPGDLTLVQFHDLDVDAEKTSSKTTMSG